MSETDDLGTRFARELLRVAELENQGDFEAAVRALQDFSDRHSTEDPEGWLQRQVRFHQATIWRLAGDLPRALRMFRAVGPNSHDRGLYVLTSYCIAAVLDQLGDARQAFEELQRSFDTAGGEPEATDLGSIALYLDIAARLDEPVPWRHQDIARKVVDACGIRLPEDDSRIPGKLRAAVAEANARRRAESAGPGGE